LISLAGRVKNERRSVLESVCGLQSQSGSTQIPQQHGVFCGWSLFQLVVALCPRPSDVVATCAHGSRLLERHMPCLPQAAIQSHSIVSHYCALQNISLNLSKRYNQSTCSSKKMQKKRPQPEIESGTSCNLEKPKAGIIPLDH
jgi:hypothetical protein